MTLKPPLPENSQKLPLNTLLRRLRVASDIFGKKRVVFTHLAEKYEVDRRTIYEDVQWIRSNFNLELIQKAVQDKVAIALDEVVNPLVILKYGLPFLAKGITQKTEMKGKIETEHKTDIHILMERYEGIIQRAASRNMANIKKNDTREQIHTSHTNT